MPKLSRLFTACLAALCLTALTGCHYDFSHVSLGYDYHSGYYHTDSVCPPGYIHYSERTYYRGSGHYDYGYTEHYGEHYGTHSGHHGGSHRGHGFSHCD